MAERNRTEGAAAPRSLDEERVAVQKLVARKLGYAIDHLATEDVTQKKAPNRQRRFIKHVFQRAEGSGEPVTVFTKAGVGESRFRKGLARFLSRLSVDEFRAPSYFGMLKLGSDDRMNLLHVWEYIAQERALTGRDWRKGRRNIVIAAAGMTSVTEEVLSKVPKLRSAISFVKPMTEMVHSVVENYSKRDVEVSSLSSGVSRLAKTEGAAIERLKSLGGYFTHNDYCVNNLFFDPDGKPVIFDWDGASLGPPGATLRNMARLAESEQVQVVDLYCAHLASKGLIFRAEDVLFALRATQVFHAVIHGGRRAGVGHSHSENLFRWGIEHIKYLAA